MVEVLAAVDTVPQGAETRSPPHSPPRVSTTPGSRDSTPAWQSELAALRREVGALRKLMLEQKVRQYERLSAETAAGPTDVSTADCSPSATREAMAKRLLAGLAIRPIEIKEGECTVVALVGPTGVGKTTTIAKLAAVASRVELKRVALIAADTYRIGAVEQLQTYAQLLDVPMTVAYGPDDV